MFPNFFSQKSYTKVQIRQTLHTFKQILSPSTIKLWPGHRLRRKNNNIHNKGSKVRTGPLYYSIVGTVKNNNNNKVSEIRTGPLYYSIVGAVINK